MRNETVSILGKTYELVPDYHADDNECSRCCMPDVLGISPALCDFCIARFGSQQSAGKRFEEVKEQDHTDEPLKEEDVYGYYQDRSHAAGTIAEQLAWMFVLMAAGVLISGNTWQVFLVCAALSVAYMACSALQAVWQAYTSWLLKQKIREGMTAYDYPSWVGGGAWLFFWLKMALIVSATVYFIMSVFG